MNDLCVFKFGEEPVRVTVRDGEPWWVLKDVCVVLGMSNPTMVADRLDDDEKMTLSVTECHSGQRGGAQSVRIVNESGLYSVILRSDKPQAKVFRKWITSEVLPSIRRTGSYTVAIPQTYAEALQLAADQAKELESKTKALEIAAPKVAFYDQVADSKTAMNMREVAAVLNILGWGRNTIFRFLRDIGVFDKKNVPYRQYQDAGYFRVIENVVESYYGVEQFVNTQTLVFQKGVDFIRREIEKEIARAKE